jgi:hypothetical protein
MHISVVRDLSQKQAQFAHDMLLTELTASEIIYQNIA